MQRLFNRQYVFPALLLALISISVGCSGGGGGGLLPFPPRTYTGNISGNITYEDKELIASGFTGTNILKAVRYAAVDVVNAKNFGILYTTWTDSSGAYNIPTLTVSTAVYICCFPN